MDGKKGNFSSFLRTRLLIFLTFFFYPFILNAQTNIITSLSSSFPEVEEEVVLTFSLPNNILSSLSIEEPVFPEGIIRVGEPSIIFNEMENQTEVILKITAKEAGFKKIPSFLFREGNLREFKSEPIEIGFSFPKVFEEKPSFSLSPLPSFLRVNQTMGLAFIVKGQSSLKDYDINSFNFIFPSDVCFLEVPLFYDLRSHFSQGREVLERPLKNWIIYFPEEGSFDNLNLKVEFNGEIEEFSLGSLEVVNLDPLVESQGIGSFEITTGIKRDSYFVEITVVLSGEGNFNRLNFPELNINQGEIIGYVEDNSLKPTENGFNGSLFRTYKIKSSNNLQIQAWVSPFIYWDTSLKEIRKIDSVSFFENDLPYNSKISLKERKDLLQPLSLEEISSLKFNFLFFNALWYLIFLPIFIPPFLLIRKKSIKLLGFLLLFLVGVSLVILFWLGLKQVEKSQSILLASQENISLEGSQEKLIQEIDTILSFPTPSYYKANLFYNKAIYLYKLGKDQEAIYYLYLSLKEAPLHIPSQKAIFTLSQLLGQDNIINFSYFYWLNYLFIGIAFTLNFYSLFFFLLKTKRVFRFFSLFFLSFIFILEIFFFIKLSFDLDRPLGVLKGDPVSLLQVPSSFASSWVFVRGGMPVYILDESFSFYRVALPSGIQAWVEKKKVNEV